jgi:photosystem II stability/assembly factor-like uncharacterized protein
LKFKFFKNTRLIHKWTGVVCAVFLLVLSVSGLLLMHREEWGLSQIRIAGKYLPQKYFHIEGEQPSVRAIVVSPADGATILLGTNQGVFRSTADGKHWQRVNQGLFNLNVTALAVSAKQPGLVLAGTVKGIFKSENFGEEWSEWFEEAGGLINTRINDMLIHPQDPDIIFAATEGGLFQTVDGGDSWIPVFTGDGSKDSEKIRTIALSQKSPHEIYLGTANGAFRGTVENSEWKKKWSALPPAILRLAPLNTDPEFIYAATENGLFKSFNNGITWLKDEVLHSTSADALFIDPQNISRIYLASGARIFFTRNGGDTWENISLIPGKNIASESPIPESVKTQSLVALDQGETPVLLAGTTSGLLTSSDQGKHWRQREIVEEDSGQHSDDETTMDLVKLMTEIHTGRFFGNHFYLLVDIATAGLLFLIVSGFAIGFYRLQIGPKLKIAADKEDEVDLIITIQDTADDIANESHQIHGMIEHINQHLEKCKTIYMKKERREIEEISRHIHVLDKKMHHLMNRIEELDNISQN